MLYLHIPFCKQACSYCNFHFSTSMRARPQVLSALEKELRIRRGELPAGDVPSVYFGGGTPSLLTEEELSSLFETLYEEKYLGNVEEGVFDRSLPPEITLEANPDDLDEGTLAMLRDSPVNRLSIGIQSFFEGDLRFMNRAHSATEARTAVKNARQAGFSDLSIDLIYGSQTTTDAMWAENLRIATELGVPHISAYALTVEPGTALGHRVAKGRVPDTDDEKFARHFDLLVDHLTAHGYHHYEVSNFSLPGHHSHHNSGYWSGEAYLGIGPGAHGFDGVNERKWNIENNATYAKAWADIRTHEDYLAAAGLLFEREQLTKWDLYNEYVMTALRRDAGLTLQELHERFGAEAVPYFSKSQTKNVAKGFFHPGTESGRYRLTRLGITHADGIASDAFRLR